MICDINERIIPTTAAFKPIASTKAAINKLYLPTARSGYPNGKNLKEVIYLIRLT
ncbi:hypothetical protein GCM10027347_52290 [Larkinella harenae]